MTRPARTRLLIVQTAALSRNVVEASPALEQALPGIVSDLSPVFPALTCPAQASFRTAAGPALHGVVANGRFDRVLCRADFWEQSAALVAGARIWDGFRQRGGRVGMLFWQQSLGERVDLVLSPAPIHKHGGGMIEDCYSQPPDLYPRLCDRVGGPFRLRSYWGPLASRRSTEWIAAAAGELLRIPEKRPDLLLCYLPHLDYDLQRHGPDDAARLRGAADALAGPLHRLVTAGREAGYKVLVWGDYAMAPARRAVFPNALLRRAGLLETRRVGRRLYLDLYRSRAFALVDHQIAHIYVRDPSAVGAVCACLEAAPGLDVLLDQAALPHPESGEFIAVAEADAWFAYPWWESPGEAPDFARHVDIHRKPGYDPCELFFGQLLPPAVSLNTAKVRGTHGRPEAPACFATDIDLDRCPADIADLGACLRAWLDRTP
ncbi:MAG: alkaline phosphatase family protein [Kiritimatiellaeota bacterium]|nr:alkaline phosphatase family protein [Kiritimatiellota bacterium]